MDQSKGRNIFIKQSDLPKESHVLKYEELTKSIPEDAVTSENLELQKTNNEWRWRFFEYNNKVLVEISIRIPETMENGNITLPTRKYINKYGKMVTQDIDPIFDKYVTRQYFYYVNE